MSAKSVLAALVLLTAGCEKVTEAPVPDWTQSGDHASPVDLVLAARVETRVDSLLRITFVDVTADSRCPSSVQCIWAGDGDVELAVGIGMGPSYPIHLHTTLDPRSVDLGGYHITLLDLMPYPAFPGQIPLDEYVVRLRVERLIR